MIAWMSSPVFPGYHFSWGWLILTIPKPDQDRHQASGMEGRQARGPCHGRGEMLGD